MCNFALDFEGLSARFGISTEETFRQELAKLHEHVPHGFFRAENFVSHFDPDQTEIFTVFDDAITRRGTRSPLSPGRSSASVASWVEPSPLRSADPDTNRRSDLFDRCREIGVIHSPAR